MQTNLKRIKKETVAEGAIAFKFSKPKGFEFCAGKPIHYLSGPDRTVKALRTLLVDLKVNESDIRTEEFPGC